MNRDSTLCQLNIRTKVSGGAALIPRLGVEPHAAFSALQARRQWPHRWTPQRSTMTSLLEEGPGRKVVEVSGGVRRSHHRYGVDPHAILFAL